MLKEKNLIDCNSVNILMKAENTMEISNIKDYKEINIKVY